MDRKAIVILLVSFGLLLGWSFLVNRLYPPIPVPEATNTVAQATNPLAAPPSAPPPGTPPAGLETGLPSPATAAPFVRTETPEHTLTLESDKARFVLTSHGGGLKLGELKEYPATVACGGKSPRSTNGLAAVNDSALVPAAALLDGGAIQGDGLFELRRTANGARAEKTLTNGLRLVKEFALTNDYLVRVTVRIENRAEGPVALPAQEWVLGTATPINRHDDGRLLGLMWSNGAKVEKVNEGWFANRTLGCFPGTPRTLYAAGASNVAWAAVHNQFFTIAAVPREPAPRVVSRHVDLAPPSAEDLAADPRAVQRPFGFQTAFVYPELTLAPGQSVERQFTLFVGPKEYKTLARHASEMGNDLDAVMGFGGFFGFFAKLLLLSMNGLHDGLGLSYALAIIVITVLIKLVFWPLTNASTKSMKRMAQLQPQMKALQERYKDDPKKMNQKLMEFMKEHKVNPMGGCLPMLLQIPVFFGFYTMLQSAIELRGARFLWACDLSQPDTLFVIPFLNFPFNPLPLLMGATMLWQSHLTPPSPGMDPVQQKIMKYMPLMFLVFLYNFAAGLTLYWTVQNLLSIAQMKITKAQDTKAAAGTASPAAPVGPPPRKKKR
jgi:YidC/Oxa1 family membrane protein insertase